VEVIAMKRRLPKGWSNPIKRSLANDLLEELGIERDSGMCRILINFSCLPHDDGLVFQSWPLRFFPVPTQYRKSVETVIKEKVFLIVRQLHLRSESRTPNEIFIPRAVRCFLAEDSFIIEVYDFPGYGLKPMRVSREIVKTAPIKRIEKLK
jgi:hypothetical protein